MTRQEFKELFEATLEKAAKNVEEQYQVNVPRYFEVEFHGLGYSGDLISIETAVDRMYLGDDLFYYLIDVGVKEADAQSTRVYVAVSAHSPRATINETWNQPVGSGPFKQIISLQFRFTPNQQ